MHTMTNRLPIKFNAHGVQRILGGTQLQTRRPVKPQPDPWRDECPIEPDPDDYRGEHATWIWTSHEDTGCVQRIECPFGSVGQELYVCEPWLSSRCVESTNPNKGHGETTTTYKAQNPNLDQLQWQAPGDMTEDRSRLTLRATAICVERLNSISVTDLQLEGYRPKSLHEETAHIRARFMSSWDSIYESRGYGSDGDPWCWVIDFEVIL